MSALTGVRVALGRRLARLFGEFDSVGRDIPKYRPRICRLGLHNWGAWSVAEGNYRRLESSCRRCRERRILIYKGKSIGASETLAHRGGWIAALIRREECRRRLGK